MLLRENHRCPAILLVVAVLAGSCTGASPSAPPADAGLSVVTPATVEATRGAADSSTVANLPGPPGTVYYVRPDGGSQQECTGLVDMPYEGAGEQQPCAWDHPFRALPPGGQPRLAGGDTLVIAVGSFRMGYGAPGTEGCDLAGSFDCHMPPVPSGVNADHPTRILGAGWDRGCNQPPELWGSGRPWFIVNLTASSHVELACLEITDHSACVEDHTGSLACERDAPPYGDWAAYGLFAQDSADVLLRDLDIHGLAVGGIHAGRLRNWVVERVRLAGNGWVGWDGDLWDDNGDANAGNLVFRHWVVEWNGCAETYPGGEPTGCWGQEAGGYGDGVGTGATGGNWLIEDSSFLHNTSDGLDLLHHTLGGTVTLDRVRAEGNGGNQVKVTGETRIHNSVLVGNCAFFEGQPFTYQVDHCRALGNTLALFFRGGERTSILNSTLYGQGDGLVMAGPHADFTCTGDERILARNSIFLGDVDYFDPFDVTFIFYQEDCADLVLDADYDLIYRAKNIECGAAAEYTASGAHDRCADPLLAGPLSGTSYGMVPGPGSPAIDGGDDGVCPPVDMLGRPRPVDGNGDGRAVCDIGAHEVPVP